MKQAIAIYRATRFSPNSVENDRAILQQAASLLSNNGYSIQEITEEEFLSSSLPQSTSLILTMARSEEVLNKLELLSSQNRHLTILNAPSGIKKCSDRQSLIQTMTGLHLPSPPEKGEHGIWIKKGKGTTEIPEDTVFCKSEEEVTHAIETLHQRGIKDIVRQAHIPGDLVKFYGVAMTPFFYYFYPTDSGRSKFGSETHNGQAHHYRFESSRLQESVNRLATHIGVCIYGGDAIVKEDGSFVIIDFNDWPTFSPCREEAAKAISSLAESMVCSTSKL